jgi:hypothetical protein
VNIKPDTCVQAEVVSSSFRIVTLTVDREPWSYESEDGRGRTVLCDADCDGGPVVVYADTVRVVTTPDKVRES